MKWTTHFQHPESMHFIIDEDSEAGFYLYVYETEAFYQRDIANAQGKCPSYQRNHLQDTLYWAQQQAEEEYGVPMDSWQEID